MKVDINGLRLNLAQNYNDLTRSLKDNDIDNEDVLDELNNMRRLIISLMCVYLEDEPSFRSLADEVELLSPYDDLDAE